MTGTSVSQRIPSAVPTTSAINTGGAYFEKRRGQSRITASVTTASTRAW